MENHSERSPQEALQLIHTMNNKAQNRFGENGNVYLLWGWVILACSILHYSMMRLSDIKHP